ncbi:hypothetical protein PVAP13_5NG046616 [Panicum virgatum]|uniref:Uncharacterized protein n=1 Tax=Panicum virgatum TaxID=38727 RepID=A0A8T0RN07_PANVG|nr:hypothetical protein PVAP13_5NG046616 [Panicum virgatum]
MHGEMSSIHACVAHVVDWIMARRGPKPTGHGSEGRGSRRMERRSRSRGAYMLACRCARPQRAAHAHGVCSLSSYLLLSSFLSPSSSIVVCTAPSLQNYILYYKLF